MSNIPLARERLEKLANQNPEFAHEIDDIIGLLHRKPPARKAPAQSRAMTPALQEEIRQYAALYPNLGYRQIGAKFDVSIGRVSEALNCKEIMKPR